MNPPESTFSPLLRQTLLWIAFIAAVGVLMYVLAPVLTPFLIAAIVGYILNPGVDWMQKHRVPRWLGTTIMLVVMIAAVFLLVLIILPVLQKEFLTARQKIPDLLTRMQTGVAPKLSSLFGVDIEFSAEALRSYATEHFNFESIGQSALAYLRVGSAAALSWFATAFLVPIVLFYLLIDWHMIWTRLASVIPRGLHATRLGAMAGEVDQVLAQFLRGQLMVMLILAVYYSRHAVDRGIRRRAADRHPHRPARLHPVRGLRVRPGARHARGAAAVRQSLRLRRGRGDLRHRPGRSRA